MAINVQDTINSVLQSNNKTIQPVPTVAPGAMQYSDAGQASMMQNPVAPTFNKTSTPAVAQSATSPAIPVSTAPNPADQLQQIADRLQVLKGEKEPTIGESFGSPTFDKLKSYDELYPDIDENAIRKQQLQLFQGQIDATNQIYDQMLNESRMEGQGRLGSQRAMAARGGLLGSDFGASQKEKVVGYNNDINRAIQAERLAKIGNIMGEVRSAVTAQLTEKREARQQGAENYLNYLKNESTMKQGNLNLAATALLTQGIDPTTLDENELAAIATEAGVSTNDIIMQYRQLASQQESASAVADQKSRKTEAEIRKIESDIASGKIKTIGEGTMLYNTETGETFKNPKTYAPGSGSGGSSALNLTADGQRTLLGGGWNESEISVLQEGVRQYGLQSVIEQEKKAGASDAQIKALEKVYKTDGDEGTFLSTDYFSSLFGEDKLKEAAKEAGTVTGGNDYIPFNEKGDTATYLNELMSTVELYRQAGYTDQEILKMMQ